MVEDWPLARKRWEAWWHGDLFDRVVTCIAAPREGVKPAPVPESNPETQWMDADFMIRRTREEIRTTWYGGERVPLFWHNWSVGHALMFGCRPHFTPDTVWADPAPAAANGYPSFDGWERHPHWAWLVRATEQAVAASRGEYFVMPMWGNHAVDNLAVVRGAEQLAIDVAENPGWVADAVERLSGILMEQFDRLWQIVRPPGRETDGSVNYCGCWSPAKTMGFDCDFSCMVSPDAFRRLFLPPLLQTMHTVDHRIYHLDGVCALQHLDTLLELPEIHAIQWVPGAGREAILQWVPMLQRIQAKGKALHLSVAPQEIEPLLRTLRPQGLCLCTYTASESEGRRLLKQITEWS